jgi:hypothetical protein
VYQDDDELDKLLARGHLSGAQYDSVEKRVLDRVAPRPKHLLRWLPLAAAGLVLGVATLHVTEDSSFRSKGSGPGPAVINLGCGRELSRDCRAETTLLFTVNAALGSGHFGAYATPLDVPDGERIWYFPDASGKAPIVGPGAGTVVLPSGIRIGSEHASGRYRVTAWLSRQPLSREELDQAPPNVFLSRESLEMQVMR